MMAAAMESSSEGISGPPGRHRWRAGCRSGRLGEGELVLQHADDEAADDVDEEDHDARDGIPFTNFGGTVHGAVKSASWVTS